MKPILVTSGEPAGIGPDLVLQLAIPAGKPRCFCVVTGDPKLLETRAKALNLDITIEIYKEGMLPRPKTLLVKPFYLKEAAEAGKLNPNNAQYVLDQLNFAVDACMAGDFSAVVTAPVHKGIINEAGHKFSGHTELLAERSNTKQVVMMLATEGLRVALATTHLPLREVADAIHPAMLEEIIRITYASLQTQFGIAQPELYIAGLNPHAGEDGHLGMEEIEVINPVIQKLQAENFNISGSYPADTMFTPDKLKKADAFLAMYHDQGLPVLKHLGFGKAVNITLGLPFIRTSVDHGTALEIAGTGKASASSLFYAVEVAQQMINAQK